MSLKGVSANNSDQPKSNSINPFNDRQAKIAKSEKGLAQVQLATLGSEIAELRADKSEYMQEQQAANSSNDGAVIFVDTSSFNRSIEAKENLLLDYIDKIIGADIDLSRHDTDSNGGAGETTSIQEEGQTSFLTSARSLFDELGNTLFGKENDHGSAFGDNTNSNTPEGTFEEKAHVEQQVIGECACAAIGSAAKRLGLTDVNRSDRELMDSIRQDAKPGSGRHEGMQIGEIEKGLISAGFEDVKTVGTDDFSLEGLAQKAESNKEAVFLMVNAGKLPVDVVKDKKKKGNIGHLIELRGQNDKGNYLVQDSLVGGKGTYELTPAQLKEAMSSLPKQDRNKAIIGRVDSEQGESQVAQSLPKTEGAKGKELPVSTGTTESYESSQEQHYDSTQSQHQATSEHDDYGYGEVEGPVPKNRYDI